MPHRGVADSFTYACTLEMGIQSIVTLIDFDSPEQPKDEDRVFTTEEIVLTLHDENIEGRLFKMKAW